MGRRESENTGKQALIHKHTGNQTKLEANHLVLVNAEHPFLVCSVSHDTFFSVS